MTADSVDIWKTAKRAQDRVQAYFKSRVHQHDIDGIKQAISDVTSGIIILDRNPDFFEVSDRASYIAMRIQDFADSKMSLKRKAECRFGLEVLADEMGIKNETLNALALRQGGMSV